MDEKKVIQIVVTIPIDELEKIISESLTGCLKNNAELFSKKEEIDQILSVKQVSVLLGLKESTIYKYIQKSFIPFSKKGKNIYFSKKEVFDWAMSARSKSKEKIGMELDDYFAKKGKIYK